MRLSIYKVLFVIAWSSGFIAADYLYPAAHTSAILFWRYLAASLSLALPMMVLKGRVVNLRAWCLARRTALIRAGAVGVIAHTVWLYAVIEAQRYGVSPGANSLINAAQPLLTAAVAPLFLREPNNPRVWVGLLVAFAGVTLTVYDGISAGASLAAHLIPVISVVAMTTSFMIEKGFSTEYSRNEPSLSPTASLLVQSVAATVAAGLIMLAVQPQPVDADLPFILAMAWVTYIPSLAAYALLWVVLRRSSAAETSSLFYFSPVATLFMQAMVLGTPVRASEVVGSAIVAAGVAFAFSTSRRRGSRSTFRRPFSGHTLPSRLRFPLAWEPRHK
ncbi:MAG: DMT family transporter [Spirochaetales bacterium]